MPPNGGQTHPPPRRALQKMAEGGVPQGELKDPPRMERCMCLVDILQQMWRTGEIPQDMGWTVLLLIPKVNTGTWGIGLLETLWKVVEALIDTCIRARLHLHDVFHVFRERIGTGMSIMEFNLAQELSRIDQYPLFLVFLDLRKAYGTVYQ